MTGHAIIMSRLSSRFIMFRFEKRRGYDLKQQAV